MILLKGILIGISVAAPIGPISLVCMRWTLTQGRKAGYLAALGAVTADLMYASLAVFGFAGISTLLTQYQLHIQIIGAIILLLLGIQFFFSKPTQTIGQENTTKYLHAYSSTFLINMVNPVVILSFIAIFSGLGMFTVVHSAMSSLLLIIGVVIGALMSLFVLIYVVSLFKHYLSPQVMIWVNRLSGVLIASLGIIPILQHLY